MELINQSFQKLIFAKPNGNGVCSIQQVIKNNEYGPKDERAKDNIGNQ